VSRARGMLLMLKVHLHQGLRQLNKKKNKKYKKRQKTDMTA
jgi:hypothetical protein